MPTFFQSLSFGPLTQALSWTLVHSLWQGGLAALLAALAILGTRNARPALRYRLFGSLLLLLAGAVAVTFFRELALHAGREMAAAGALRQAGLLDGKGQSVPSLQEPGLRASLILFLNRWSWLITGIWLACCCLKGLRLVSSLQGAHRLRTRGTALPEERWTALLLQLASKLQIRRPVQLLESALVELPAVIGWLKPVVLVPAGLLTRLPADQVEAVLLHELAHIRRGDYGINLLQRALEVLLFFNPFLLWISALLREEREACCDELAVSVTQNKEAFVGALISFGEAQLRPGGLALGFGSRRQPLLDRVRRIAFSRNKALSRLESLLAGISLVFFITAAFAFNETRTTAATRPVSAALVKTITIATGNLPPEVDSVKVASAIAADLITAGVVRREELVSFRLDEAVLIVNGRAQPAWLHRRLKDRYLPQPGARMEYRNSTTGEAGVPAAA